MISLDTQIFQLIKIGKGLIHGNVFAGDSYKIEVKHCEYGLLERETVSCHDDGA